MDILTLLDLPVRRKPLATPPMFGEKYDDCLKNCALMPVCDHLGDPSCRLLPSSSAPTPKAEK